MRPNFTMWSDYGAPAQRQWMSSSKRGAGSSIGPKILLAAVVVVAGVIGISGIYPQVIDAEWMQDSGTHLPLLSLPTSAATKPSSTASAFALRARHAVTTGQAVATGQGVATGQAVAVSPPRRAAPAAAVPQPRTSVAAVAPPPPIAQAAEQTLAPAAAVTAPLALAEIPDAEAKAEAPATEPSPAKAVEKQMKVVKKRVAHHQRSFAGAYAQYGGWGWGGWSGFGGYRRY
jgi:hypothetical protein